MTKIGRNEPCPCVSGKKYKQCCLAKDEAADNATFALVQAAIERDHDHDEICDGCYDDLVKASNAVADLVRTGKLDDAERAAVVLQERFPDLYDGYDRLGLVFEARGEKQKAAEYYRKAIDVIRAHPDDYDPDFAAVFEKLVDRLDPATT